MHAASTDATSTTTTTTTNTARRIVLVVVATAAMLLGLMTTAQARTNVEQGPYQEGLFYGDSDANVIMLAGATAEDFCNGDEPVHDARFVTKDDGSLVITVAPRKRQPLFLYATPLGSPEFVDATCDALEDDDPSTVPVEPFAQGPGRMKLRIEVAPNGDVHIVNSSWGSVRSEDGTRFRVRGRADLMVVDGAPVGSPTEFQSLRIVRRGR